MHRVHRLERTLPSRWVRPSPGPFLALLLSLALGLIAMGSLSYAQEPPTDKAPNAEAPADNASPSRPRGPCETPRQALVTFDTYVQEPDKNPARAALCFDLSAYGISRESQLEVPEKLKTVLDARGLSFFPSQIPDKANYADPDTGRPEYTPFGPRLEEVFLRRVGDRWVFPPSVVRQISILYDNTFAFGIQRAASELPSWMHTVVLGVKVWKVVALLLCTLLCWLLAVAIQASLSRGFLKIAEQAGWSWGEEAVETSQRWIRLLLTSVAMTPLVSELMLPASMTRIVMFALQLVMTVSVVMLLWRLIDVLCNFLAARAAGTETKLDDQLIPLVRKTLKIVLVTVAVLFILQNMNVDVRSLLAGLGLGGLAIALAAKDTLANIFGSITIFADRPFQIGDWISLNGVEGTVEEVGFRSTRIRTFYKSLVTLPNSTVANATIDNLGVRTFRRLKLTLQLTYDTTPDQIEAFVEGIRAILKGNEAVVQDTYEVHFNSFGESSLGVLIYCFLDVPTWSDELTQKQQIFLQFMRLAQAMEISFAFPTQTLHVTPNSAPATSPTREELAAIVDSFAQHGARSLNKTPKGVSTTDYQAPKRGEGSEDDSA